MIHTQSTSYIFHYGSLYPSLYNLLTAHCYWIKCDRFRTTSSLLWQIYDAVEPINIAELAFHTFMLTKVKLILFYRWLWGNQARHIKFQIRNAQHNEEQRTAV